MEQQDNTLFINGPITIFTAASARDAILRTGPFQTVNLSGVSAIDWAGAQVLIAMKRSARESGRQLAFQEHSDAVLRIFNLMGLSGWFGDQLVRPAHLREELGFLYGTRKTKS